MIPQHQCPSKSRTKQRSDMTTQPTIPDGANSITAEWMQQALNSDTESESANIRDIVVEPLGSATNALGNLVRCHLTSGEGSTAPSTVIVKLPTPNRAAFRFAKWLSLHERECLYYSRLAGQSGMRSPSLFYSAFEEKTHRFVLVLEDLQNMEVISQLAGVGAGRARLAIREIGGLHGRFWGAANDPSLAGCCEVHGPKYRRFLQVAYVACLPLVLERFSDCIPAESRSLAEAFAPEVNTHYAAVAAGPATLVHGDYRSENLFFGPSDTDFAVIDWQGCGLGAGVHDIAYFLGTSVTVDVRREVEREALQEYHAVLCRMGVNDFTFDDCWRSYRQNMLTSLVPCILACGGLDMQDQRLRDLARAGLKRILTAIEDLNAREFLPARRGPVSGGNALWTLAKCVHWTYRFSRRVRMKANDRSRG